MNKDGDGERVKSWRATVKEDKERSFAAEVGHQKGAVASEGTERQDVSVRFSSLESRLGRLPREQRDGGW